jgi:hypothetical protein
MAKAVGAPPQQQQQNEAKDGDNPAVQLTFRETHRQVERR